MADANHDVILGALTRTVVERFAPERIVLFGSRARGDHRPESDYDLMVVLDQPPDPRDIVARAVHDILHNVDVLVDTREQFEHRRTDVGTLEYAVDQEGQILYARSAEPIPRQVREASNDIPESVQEWIARAQTDFTMMQLGFDHAAGVNDAIVFHAHQGVEKTLKAALVARLVPPPRTHRLIELLQSLPDEVRRERGVLEACAGLDALWPNARYPRQPVPTDPEVRAAVAWACQARDIIGASMDA
jgi:HEPN domain-containing protein/predicted nucleotidyltransferase